MKKWKRKKPEIADGQGDYYFNGRCVATRGVYEAIPEEEMKAIAADVNNIASKSGGIDYLQQYKNQESGMVIWVIDQVTQSALKSGDHPPEHNYFTILFPSEY